MDGYQYEHQCARALKKKGFSNVTVTRKSGDQGIDILAYKGRKKYGIQCKYYSHPVGNKAVQEAFAGAKYYDCDVSVVLTNNNFTKSAKDLAEKINVVLWEKNQIPSWKADFCIMKYIGLLFCLAGLGGLLFFIVSDVSEHTFLKKAASILLLIGGICNIAEKKKWKVEWLAGIAYSTALIIYLVICAVAKQPINYKSALFAFPVLAAFFRAYYLYRLENKADVPKRKRKSSKRYTKNDTKKRKIS